MPAHPRLRFFIIPAFKQVEFFRGSGILPRNDRGGDADGTLF
jgi:hypothetical protein